MTHRYDFFIKPSQCPCNFGAQHFLPLGDLYKMKLTHPSAKFISSLRRALAISFVVTAAGVTVAHADSPTVTLVLPNTSLLKAGNWSGTDTNPPTAGQTGIIAEGAATNPLGWNNNTNPGTTEIGDLDFVSGATNLVIGNYTTKAVNQAVNIELGGSTLNNISNTIIANSSGNTITFENDVAPSGDDLAETGLTTYTLVNSSNTIQATSGSNIIIDNVITGSGDSLTFVGGGSGSTAGATLELGAGSANDVTGGVAANAPTPANGGSFTSTAVVQTSDKNTFTGGLTIGVAGGTNAGTVKVDGANALPTTGTVTVNTNSQLLLNGNATYATSQVTLNGTGTGGATNGALATTSGNVSTLQGTVSLASTSAVDVAGTTGQLTLSGQVTGNGQLQSVGTGSLVLSNATNNYSGGTKIASGTVVAENVAALGTGAATVSGGTLKTTVSTLDFGGLTLSSGVVALNSATFNLSSGTSFSQTGGTLDLSAGTPGAIDGSGAGTFSLSSGTLDLGGNTGWNYADTYDILNGFASGSVSNLTITDYDTTDFTASVNDAGVLSFTATPEPKSLLLGALAAAFLAVRLYRRKSA